MKNPIELRELVRRYGTNSNAFFALYPGFSSYPAAQGEAGVAYLRTKHAHVGVTEPFANPKDRIEILAEFFRYSRDQRADALSLPIGQDLVKQARERQFEVIPIGTEVLFDLDQMGKRGDEWSDALPAARQLADRGGRVREIPDPERSDELRLLLSEIYQDWNESKGIPPLGFLNRIEPWTLAEDKKLFVVEAGGRIVAFLSAIPIWSRNGWYLVDLIRSPKAPIGSSELLLLNSMRLLHEQKSKWISLGVAPLADLKEVQFGKRKILYRVLNRIFEYDSGLYACKSLYQFKLKFRPTHLEPAYLVAAKGTSIVRILRALGEAYLPLGLVGTTLDSSIRAARRALGFGILDRIMDPEIVLRPLPTGMGEFVRRSIFSWFLMATWVGIYMQSLHHGIVVDNEVKEEFGFLWSAIHGMGWNWLALRRVLFSGFIHEDLLQLWLNLALMVFVGPTLEMLWGETVFLVAFFVPLLLANSITALLYQSVIVHLPPFASEARAALATLDVGSSLGVFGCFGGLLLSLRRRFIWTLCAISVVVGYCALSHHWIHLNHLVAMGLGVLVVNLLQWKKRLMLRYAY